MKVCGIDIGFSGAAALFGHPDGAVSNFPRVLDIYDFRTVGDGGGKRIDITHFQSWLLDCRPDRAYIENATAMPSIPDKFGVRRGMGAGTAGRYMRCAGHIEATVACCGIEATMVSPGPWKKFFGLVGPNKDNSIDMILDLCPEAGRWLKLKKHHNRAESALIAVYGATRMDMIDIKARG